MIKMIIPYNPDPTPPKMISPSIILNIATNPDNGDKLSCMAFTEPFDVTVVVTDQRTLFITPETGFLSFHGTRNIKHIIMTIFSPERDSNAHSKEYKHGNKYRTCLAF